MNEHYYYPRLIKYYKNHHYPSFTHSDKNSLPSSCFIVHTIWKFKNNILKSYYFNGVITFEILNDNYQGLKSVDIYVFNYYLDKSILVNQVKWSAIETNLFG